MVEGVGNSGRHHRLLVGESPVTAPQSRRHEASISTPLHAALNSKPNQRVGDRSRGRGEFILCVSFVMFPFERPPLARRSPAENANDAVFHRILRSVQWCQIATMKLAMMLSCALHLSFIPSQILIAHHKVSTVTMSWMLRKTYIKLHRDISSRKNRGVSSSSQLLRILTVEQKKKRQNDSRHISLGEQN